MNFEEQKKLLDVEWFEGPFMSLFSNNKGDLYIYKWVDVGPSGHTWLVFRTNPDLLVAYVQQVISEKALILLAPGKRWHLVDISPSLTFCNLRIIQLSELKQDYLPDTHTYFNPSDCPDLAKLDELMSQELVTA